MKLETAHKMWRTDVASWICHKCLPRECKYWCKNYMIQYVMRCDTFSMLVDSGCSVDHRLGSLVEFAIGWNIPILEKWFRF